MRSVFAASPSHFARKSTTMSEEPIFDPTLKKRKKKAVTFTEDPLGADADPTAPAPTTIDSTTADGEAVDLGPKTAHELMANTNDDMFADLKKKKKKKKEIPMDFVRCALVFCGYGQSDQDVSG